MSAAPHFDVHHGALPPGLEPAVLPQPIKHDEATVTVAAAAAAAVEHDNDIANVAAGIVEGTDRGLAPDDAVTAGAAAAANKKRCRQHALTFHEALAYANRGIYIDLEANKIRCSCNHKPANGWDTHRYLRHFSFKVHKKYENERLDHNELARLRESKENYFRMHPVVEEVSLRRRRRVRDTERMLTAEELRVQERHWMDMWRDVKSELKKLRRDLKGEEDDEVREELMEDIEGLKKKKGEWAKLLGLVDSSKDDF